MVLGRTKMTFTKVILFGCLLCFSLHVTQYNLSAQDTPGGEKIDPSAVLLPSIELKGTTIAMFATLMQTTGLSGGIATAQRDCTHGHEGTFSLPAGTSLAEALNVIASDEGLTWQINDNVINMGPSAALPSLLDMYVSSFYWDRTESLVPTIVLFSTQ